MTAAFVALTFAFVTPTVDAELFAVVGREQNVSPRLLRAIALVESGYGGRAWPWTLNIEGKPFRFSSREAAHTALVGALRRGTRSIDVGYMQVNVAWHGHRLGNTWAALDPHRNLTVGAQILRENAHQTGDARAAVALYHSSTAWRGERYLARVSRVYSGFGEDPR